MRLVKLAAKKLEPGMFVAELDRPWLETPFALQGFVVRDYDDVLYVAKYVDQVYVDAEFNGDSPRSSRSTTAAAPRANSTLELKADYRQAKLLFDRAAETLAEVLEALRVSGSGDIDALKVAMAPLIEAVFHNQDAVAAMLRSMQGGDYRYTHGVSTAIWGIILGRHLGLHQRELETLAVGCALCDVGMTDLPRELLEARGRLSAEERILVEAHAVQGMEIVAECGDADFEILSIIESHHERLDGSGYPAQLSGSAIPLLARIAGLADTYDAMINVRPHALARTTHEAMQELIDCKGVLFQESLVEQFVQAVGLFPTGSLVELNTGEVAIVARQNDRRRIKPELVVITDADKVHRDIPELLDLAGQEISPEGDRWISRELPPGTAGVFSEDYFI